VILRKKDVSDGLTDVLSKADVLDLALASVETGLQLIMSACSRVSDD
jgi:hypothetical protein